MADRHVEDVDEAEEYREQQMSTLREATSMQQRTDAIRAEQGRRKIPVFFVPMASTTPAKPRPRPPQQ
jgi:hypothetical protein